MINYPKTIIDLLDNAAEKWADDIAYEKESDAISFKQVQNLAKKVATEIAKSKTINSPILVWSTRAINTPSLFFGVVYSGNFYLPVGDDTPIEKVQSIIQSIQPKLIIVNDSEEASINKITNCGLQIIYADKCKEINEELLTDLRKNIIDIDPQMIILTSGSTGVPKGVVTNGRSVMELLSSMVDTYNIDKNTIIGGQSPFYYSAHRRDVYLPVFCGCKLVIIPKQFFTTVANLVPYINEKKINFIQWTTSVFSIIHNFNAFEKEKPMFLKTLIFMGEPIKLKTLKYLLNNLPSVNFFNSYGLTELPDSLIYHKIDVDRDYLSGVPLGKVVKNRRVILHNDEMYVSSTAMAMQYYNDIEKTKEKFVQNPLHSDYEDIMFRTGDLAVINEYGEYIFKGRIDNCIKHMGHRIELGEIEHIASTCNNSGECACVYNDDKEQICLFYTGESSIRDISIELRQKLPNYSVPRVFIQLDKLPRLFNGKIDMCKLKGMVK